jgi:predicted nucleotidyltransferase
VHDAVVRWAAAAVDQHAALAIGYFGSYAQGTWGVGSDVDLVAIVPPTEKPFEARGVGWDTTGLPVPADLLVYTVDEWRGSVSRADRFSRMLATDVVWVVGEAPH